MEKNSKNRGPTGSSSTAMRSSSTAKRSSSIAKRSSSIAKRSSSTAKLTGSISTRRRIESSDSEDDVPEVVSIDEEELNHQQLREGREALKRFNDGQKAIRNELQRRQSSDPKSKSSGSASNKSRSDLDLEEEEGMDLSFDLNDPARSSAGIGKSTNPITLRDVYPVRRRSEVLGALAKLPPVPARQSRKKKSSLSEEEQAFQTHMSPGKRQKVLNATFVTEPAAEPERVEYAQSSSQPVMTSTPARIESDAHSMYISPVTANRSMMIPLANEILTVNPRRVLPRHAREQVDRTNDGVEEHGHPRSLSQPNDTPLGLRKVAAVGRLHVPPIEQESGVVDPPPPAVLTPLPSMISHPTENTQGGNQKKMKNTKAVAKKHVLKTSMNPVVILENTKSKSAPAPMEVEEDGHVSPISNVFTDSEDEDGSDVENVSAVVGVGHPQVPPIEQESAEVVVVPAVSTPMLSRRSHPAEETQAGKEGAQESRIKNPLKKKETTKAASKKKKPVLKKSKKPVLVLKKTKSAQMEVEDNHVSRIQNVFTDSEDEDGSDVENVPAVAAVGRPQTPPNQEESEVVGLGAPAVSSPLPSRRSRPTVETQTGKESAHQDSRITTPSKKTIKAASKKKPVLKKSKKPVPTLEKRKSIPMEVEDNHVSRIQNVFTDSEDEDGSDVENVPAVAAVGPLQTPPNQEESEMVDPPVVSSPLRSRRSHPTEDTQAGKEGAHQESRETTPLKKTKTTKAASKKKKTVLKKSKKSVPSQASASRTSDANAIAQSQTSLHSPQPGFSGALMQSQTTIQGSRNERRRSVFQMARDRSTNASASTASAGPSKQKKGGRPPQNPQQNDVARYVGNDVFGNYHILKDSQVADILKKLKQTDRLRPEQLKLFTTRINHHLENLFCHLSNTTPHYYGFFTFRHLLSTLIDNDVLPKETGGEDFLLLMSQLMTPEDYARSEGILYPSSRSQAEDNGKYLLE